MSIKCLHCIQIQVSISKCRFFWIDLFPPPSSSTHNIIHKYANVNTDPHSGLTPPALCEAVFFRPRSCFFPQRHTPLECTRCGIPSSLSSQRTPVCLSRTVFAVSVQYFLSSSTFLLFCLLLPGSFMTMSLHLSLALHHCCCKPLPSPESYIWWLIRPKLIW